MKRIVDGSLDKIHEIQERHYRERQNWSWEKEKSYYQSLPGIVAKELKAKLIRTEFGTLKFKK